MTVNQRWSIQKWEMPRPCDRCKDHPGIDPDVISTPTHNIPVEGNAVVVPLEDTNDLQP